MNLKVYKEIQNLLLKYPQKPRLLAVTKYSDIKDINNAIENWVSIIWENRLEIAEEKFKNINIKVEKHFIWTVQTKKLKKIFEIFDIIESIWSIKQLITIDEIATQEWKKANIYLQFNISKEEQKSWFDYEQIKEIFEISPKLKNTNMIWIMWMASIWNENETRKQFKLAKKIFEELKKQINTIKELSIWMSNDYKIALEQWATIVRIWSALFK